MSQQIVSSAVRTGASSPPGVQQASPPAVPLCRVSLDDKYQARTGRIYLSGIQALVRLPLVQRLRDQAAGINTGGFISAYRGSPFGGLDEAYWAAKKHLDENPMRFIPGINEDMAASSVWGTQQLHLLGESHKKQNNRKLTS